MEAGDTHRKRGVAVDCTRGRGIVHTKITDADGLPPRPSAFIIDPDGYRIEAYYGPGER
jgi:hypothetical protein